MKGIFKPDVIEAASARAIEYWTGKFEERKQAWIAETATQTEGFFRKRAIGPEKAAEYFSMGFCDVPYTGFGGVFWHEYDYLETARLINRLATNSASEHLILNSAEMATLKPVFSGDGGEIISA